MQMSGFTAYESWKSMVSQAKNDTEHTVVLTNNAGFGSWQVYFPFTEKLSLFDTQIRLSRNACNYGSQ